MRTQIHQLYVVQDFFCLFCFLVPEAPVESQMQLFQHSHSAVNEDSEQFPSQCLQLLSIVELTQGDFQLQDVVFQNGPQLCPLHYLQFA